MSHRYAIDIQTDWPAFKSRWMAQCSPGSPFQQVEWLDRWYRAFTGDTSMTPLLVAACDTATGQLAMALPLAIRRARGLSRITFADDDVTDCNAPLLGASAPRNTEAATALWSAILAALPRADLVHVVKVPRCIGAVDNPLASLPGAATSRVNAWSVSAGEDFDAYLATLGGHFRRELTRRSRLLENSGVVRFHIAKTREDADRILCRIDALQRERLDLRQAQHVFARPAHRQFYDSLVDVASPSGPVILAGLDLDGETVAGVMAVAARPRVTLLRPAQAGGPLAKLGLGHLLIERLLRALHGDGFRLFDFSIGDGDHKRRFGATPEPLYELRHALSWRGQASVALDKTREAAGRSPALRQAWRRLFGSHAQPRPDSNDA